MLCGCTPKETTNGKADSEISPSSSDTELETVLDHTDDTPRNSQEEETFEPAPTEPATEPEESSNEPGETSNEPGETSNEPVTEPEPFEDIEETVTDYVVDGGDGFVIGGN